MAPKGPSGGPPALALRPRLALWMSFACAVPRGSLAVGVDVARDSRVVPLRLGAEEALLISRKHQRFEEQFTAALSNDACAPSTCAPAAQLTLGATTEWFDAGEVNQLKAQTEAQCKRSLCQPLCLHTGWDCAVKFTGSCSTDPPPSWCTAFQSQLESQEVQLALCAQIKAHACQSVLGCCAGRGAVVTEWMEAWVRERVAGANAPVPALPLPACQADVGDKVTAAKLCDQCKTSVEPVMKAVECRWSQPTAFRPPSDLADDASPLQGPNDPFAQVGLDTSSVASKWKSMASRCKAQQKVFESKAGALTSAITAAKICSCLGCCAGTSDQCFYPMDAFSPFDAAEWAKTVPS